MEHEPQFLMPDCDQRLPDIRRQLDTETGHSFRCVHQSDDTPDPAADYVIFCDGDYYALFKDSE